MSEKYPEETGRRRFVKGVVGGATLAGAAGSTAGAVDLLTPPTGEGGGVVAYYGVENVLGPAPRPMPQIPVRLRDGVLEGVWPGGGEVEGGKEGAGRTTEEPRAGGATEGPEDHAGGAAVEVGGVTYSSRWFQYCGLQASAAVEPGADRDATLRHPPDPHYDWQRDLDAAGEPLRVEQFDDYAEWGNGIGAAGIGKPAAAYWRGDDPQAAIPVQVVRSERVEALAEESDWLAASTAAGVLAYANKCTHFCCVPGFKHDPHSAGEGAEDLSYCSCHQSAYDPFSVVKATYTALPRPDG